MVARRHRFLAAEEELARGVAGVGGRHQVFQEPVGGRRQVLPAVRIRAPVHLVPFPVKVQPARFRPFLAALKLPPVCIHLPQHHPLFLHSVN